MQNLLSRFEQAYGFDMHVLSRPVSGCNHHSLRHVPMTKSPKLCLAWSSVECSSLLTISVRCVTASLVFLICLLSTTSIAQTSDPSFIIKIYESKVSLKYGGLTANSCAIVFPGGLLHLEVRKQQLPDPRTILSIYDQMLSDQQLDTLNSILKDERISKLPPFEQPVRPFTVSRFRGFNTIIPRAKELQNAGFFATKPDGQLPPSSNLAEEEIREHWRQSETTLKPLLDWFHAITPLQPSKSMETSKLCISDPEESQR